MVEKTYGQLENVVDQENTTTERDEVETIVNSLVFKLTSNVLIMMANC